MIAIEFLGRSAALHASDAPATFAGHWEGLIYADRLNGDEEDAGVVLDLKQAGEAWTGTAKVTRWGATAWELSDFRVQDGRCRFRFRRVANGDGTFTLELHDSVIRGTYSWGGRAWRFDARHPPLARAQHPCYWQIPSDPPNYKVEDVEIGGGKVRLTGTLAIPQATSPHPAVLYLSADSRAIELPVEIPGDPAARVSRDWLLADQLARRGIAVLRMNRRGVGGSRGEWYTATVDDLRSDGEAALAYLRSRPELRADDIALMGFGDGGLIASSVVEFDNHIRTLVLLSAPAMSGERLYGPSAQKRDELSRRLIGFNDDKIRASVVQSIKQDEQVVSMIAAGTAADEVYRRCGSLFGLSQREAASRFGGLIAMTQWPHDVSVLSYDPARSLRTFNGPVLAVFGDLDMQVPAGDNSAALRTVFAHRPGSIQLVTIPGLSHWLVKPVHGDFVEIESGSADQEQLIAPEVLKRVEEWLGQRLEPG